MMLVSETVSYFVKILSAAEEQDEKSIWKFACIK